MTKRVPSFRCWAVIDATGQASFSLPDLCPLRDESPVSGGFSAKRLKRIRETVSHPTYQSAQWRVVRVEVRVIRGRK